MATSNLAKKWGIFSNLRDIQDRRIRRAQIDASLEKSPAGVSISPVGTRLFELFFVEEFETLESGLRRLFHGAARRFSGGEFLEDFRSTGLSLDITSTQRLGRIYRKEAKVLPIAPIARLDLPEEYEHLEVWIRKPYPSIYVLIIDAVFSEKGRAAWSEFKAEEVLPDMELAGWLPK
jgi:hypothetical protein